MQHTAYRHVSAERNERVSSMGLATVVAALYVAVLAARLPGRHSHLPAVLLSWSAPPTPDSTAAGQDEPPSNPHQTYSVGQLALTVGMAVVSLTRWLHVMHTSGARAY